MNDPMSGKENMATKRKKPNQTKTKQLETRTFAGFVSYSLRRLTEAHLYKISLIFWCLM